MLYVYLLYMYFYDLCFICITYILVYIKYRLWDEFIWNQSFIQKSVFKWYASTGWQWSFILQESVGVWAEVAWSALRWGAGGSPKVFKLFHGEPHGSRLGRVAPHRARVLILPWNLHQSSSLLTTSYDWLSQVSRVTYSHCLLRLAFPKLLVSQTYCTVKYNLIIILKNYKLSLYVICLKIISSKKYGDMF